MLRIISFTYIENFVFTLKQFAYIDEFHITVYDSVLKTKCFKNSGKFPVESQQQNTFFQSLGFQFLRHATEQVLQVNFQVSFRLTQGYVNILEQIYQKEVKLLHPSSYLIRDISELLYEMTSQQVREMNFTSTIQNNQITS